MEWTALIYRWSDIYNNMYINFRVSQPTFSTNYFLHLSPVCDNTDQLIDERLGALVPFIEEYFQSTLIYWIQFVIKRPARIIQPISPVSRA